MTGGVDYEWKLRLRMAERGMFATKDLRGALAERGVKLSDSQVWRLMTGRPERLSLLTLAALCDILSCTPDDLIELRDRPRTARRAPKERRAVAGEITPVRAEILDEGN
jgi:DNA-binding Xre family transcriptional regulator